MPTISKSCFLASFSFKIKMYKLLDYIMYIHQCISTIRWHIII